MRAMFPRSLVAFIVFFLVTVSNAARRYVLVNLGYCLVAMCLLGRCEANMKFWRCSAYGLRVWAGLGPWLCVSP